MMVSSRHEVLNGTTKYTTACRRGNQIADIMSRNGTTVFNAMLSALDKFEEIIKDGIAPCVSRDESMLDTFQPTRTDHVSASTTGQATTAPKNVILGEGDPDELDEDGSCDEVPKTLPTLLDSLGDCTAATAMTQREAQMATGANGVPTGTGVAVDVPTGTDGTDEVTEGTAGTDEVTKRTEGDAEDPADADKLIAGVPQSSILTKRHPASSASEGSDSSCPSSFTVRKSSKSRGRPKVRKQQKVPAKESRMARGKEKAAKLVQGTLSPVPNLQHLAKRLDEDYSYNDIQTTMQTLSERSLPQSKKAIAGIFTLEECETDIRYVFPRWYVTKAQNAITQFRNGLAVDCGEGSVGVRVPRFGIYMLKDINAMGRWHCAMENLEKAEEAANWAINTATKRISVPAELSDGVSDETAEREQVIKRMKLRGGRSTLFGSLPYVSLLSLCGNRWADDACMGHGMALLQRDYNQLGIIDPIFHRFKAREVKLRHVSTGDPFNTANNFVLLALHVDNNHWCGVVIDFRRDRPALTVFDPLQAPKSKYYIMSDVLLRDVFGEMGALMPIKKQTKSRQPDLASCGVMVLTFFECYIRGIEMPRKPSPALLRFMRLCYLLKCIT